MRVDCYLSVKPRKKYIFPVHDVQKHKNFVHNVLMRAVMRMTVLGFEEFQDFALNCSKSKKHLQHY